MESQFCPSCGTTRVGALRFCRSCGFDYDSVRDSPTQPTAMPSDGPPVVLPMAAASATPTSGRRPWLILGVVIFVAVVAAAGFISLNSSGILTPHHDVVGTFEVDNTDTTLSAITVVGGTCKGTSGYSDLGPGTPVTLKDGDGKLLGTTTLGTGSGTAVRCTFSFNFTNIPEVSFYTLEVGRRGGISYGLSDMKAQSWSMGATIGS
jgi:hypothetical protein